MKDKVQETSKNAKDALKKVKVAMDLIGYLRGFIKSPFVCQVCRSDSLSKRIAWSVEKRLELTGQLHRREATRGVEGARAARRDLCKVERQRASDAAHRDRVLQ